MKKLLLGSALMFFASLAFAEMVVIVHPSNGNTLDKDAIQRTAVPQFDVTTKKPEPRVLF